MCILVDRICDTLRLDAGSSSHAGPSRSSHPSRIVPGACGLAEQRNSCAGDGRIPPLEIPAGMRVLRTYRGSQREHLDIGLCATGDLDGDGRPELLFSEYESESAAECNGAAYVISLGRWKK